MTLSRDPRIARRIAFHHRKDKLDIANPIGADLSFAPGLQSFLSRAIIIHIIHRNYNQVIICVTPDWILLSPSKKRDPPESHWTMPHARALSRTQFIGLPIYFRSFVSSSLIASLHTSIRNSQWKVRSATPADSTRCRKSDYYVVTQ